MSTEEQVEAAFTAWYNNLSRHKASGGVAKGTLGAALVVLERLRADFDLRFDAHQAKGGAQIKGASGSAAQKILARFGEMRPFVKEGGRTNRGGPGDVRLMLEALEDAGLANLPEDARLGVLDTLQAFLVERVREYHNRERIKVAYDPARTTWQAVHDILATARESGKEGPAAQHLVGAKLQLRFPDERVENESFSTADDQLGRAGDFLIGHTAFHVTVAPMPALYEKCRRNLDDGLRAYLLVPDRVVVGTRQIAESALPGRITVESIECFVAQNIEELAGFHSGRLVTGFHRLLRTYNDRVDRAELDKSIMVHIPTNLQGDPTDGSRSSQSASQSGR